MIGPLRFHSLERLNSITFKAAEERHPHLHMNLIKLTVHPDEDR
jgi:hypothetical protein